MTMPPFSHHSDQEDPIRDEPREPPGEYHFGYNPLESIARPHIEAPVASFPILRRCVERLSRNIMYQFPPIEQQGDN